MAGKFAPECNERNCTRTTWSPSGFCPHHDTANKINLQSAGRPGYADGPTQASGNVAGSAQSFRYGISKVFPDIADEMNTNTMREQVNLTLQSAISIDVYRRFPLIDVPDEEQRESALKQYRYELMEACRISPVEYTDENAAILSRSSSDLFGRSLDDSIDLASYGVMKEYQLARMTGQTVDGYGVPYSLPYTEYCDQVNRSTGKMVSDELDNQLNSYSDIVREVTGREPNASYGRPRTSHSDPAPTQRMDNPSSYGSTQTLDAPTQQNDTARGQHTAPRQAPQSQSRPRNQPTDEATKDVLADMGKSALSFGMKAAKAGIEGRRSFKSGKDIRKQERNERDSTRRQEDLLRMQHDALNEDRSFFKKKRW